MASVEGIGDWLPRLASRLARLAALESSFQKTLEAEKLEAMAEFAAGWLRKKEGMGNRWSMWRSRNFKNKLAISRGS